MAQTMMIGLIVLLGLAVRVDGRVTNSKSRHAVMAEYQPQAESITLCASSKRRKGAPKRLHDLAKDGMLPPLPCMGLLSRVYSYF